MLKQNTLPDHVDPFRFADNAVNLQGILYINDMQRLGSALYATDGEVEVKATFGVDDQGTRFLRGKLAASVLLPCQRCLESFEYAIKSDFLLGIVRSEKEAEQLPKNYDPVIVTEEKLVLQDVFEDELIVNLPVVSMHELDDCKVKLPLEIGTKIETGKESPFKVLK